MADRGHSYRRWYTLKRWVRLRKTVLIRDRFTCRECGLLKADTSELVADHTIEHRGDEALFWNIGNLQTLCRSCHDSKKQKLEQRSINERGVWY